MPRSQRDYDELLDRKRIVSEPVGFDVPINAMHDRMFDFQKVVCRWAIKRGRAAVFAATGLGKTTVQIEWARHIHARTGRNVLILAPLAVGQQTVAEGRTIGLDVTIARSAADVRPGITIANYERLHLFDPAAFGAIVLDECFAPGTLIDTPTGKKRIQDVKIGDSIINASGVDTVADVHRRAVPHGIRLTFNGRRVISSPNHPYFTQRGWVGAQDIVPGDSIIETATALRVVRNGVQSQADAASTTAILREVLLSEMAHESSRTQGEGAYAGHRETSRGNEAALVCGGQPTGRSAARAHSTIESDKPTRGPGEDLPHIETDAPRTFRAWGQWKGDDGPAVDADGCFARSVVRGVRLVTGAADSRLSHALQDRLGAARVQNRHRGGWELPSRPEGTGREEGREAGFARVDRLEVLESGHPDLDQFRDADGQLYFYDLGATRHPSFSVNGCLVHNSSCIKGLDSAIRQQLNAFVRDIPYRLACTAAPAPNDLVELANHAEFLGVMLVKEVKALFFTQDGNSAQDWRLKGHARTDFWRWLASWSVAVRSPSDLGFADNGFALPPLTIEQHTVSGAITTGTLIPIDAITLQERQQARRDSIGERVAMAAELVNADDQPWIAWTQLNAESEAMTRAIPGAVQVTGSDSIEHKEQAIAGFLDGTYRVLVSKPSIVGFGLNLQHCARMVFVGLSDSWEQYFQAVRRCWRFGQTQPVVAHVITAETEGAVVRNIERKERQAAEMMGEVVRHMAIEHEITGAVRNETAYREDVAAGPDWTLHLGDSVKVLADSARIVDNSVGLTVFSPPFPGMYVYNNSPNDIGNCTSIDQLMEHFGYMMPELLRVTMPGRSCFIHLTQAVAFKGADGHIGIKDFRGRVISAMEAVGWIFYGEVTIDKNPQLKAIRTKDRGLLFKTLATDSANMHMALPDYGLQFRKPGDNPVPIRAGISAKYGNPNGWITPEEWIEWAAPIWLGDFRSPNGIRETDVLNVVQARETDDERHLAPLQLGVIERAVKLWSNPGDLVLDPFAGICSTGYRALQLNRRFVGVELKSSYWKSGQQNLNRALASRDQPSLLSLIPDVDAA